MVLEEEAQVHSLGVELVLGSPRGADRNLFCDADAPSNGELHRIKSRRIGRVHYS